MSVPTPFKWLGGFGCLLVLGIAGVLLWFALGSPAEIRGVNQLLLVSSDEDILRAGLNDEAKERLREQLRADAENLGLTEGELHDHLERSARERIYLGGRAFKILALYDPERITRVFLGEADAIGSESPGFGWATMVAAAAFMDAKTPQDLIDRARTYLASPSPSLRFSGHHLLTMLSFEARGPDPWTTPEGGEELLKDLDPKVWDDLDASLAARSDFRDLIARGLIPLLPGESPRAGVHRRINAGVLSYADLIETPLTAMSPETKVEAVASRLAPIPFETLKRLWAPSTAF